MPGEQPDPRPTRFMILTTQRTGSTWVRDMLDSHPDIDAYNELFLEYGRGYPDDPKYGPTDMEYFESWFRQRSQGNQLDRFRSVTPYLAQFYTKRDHGEAIGFKLMYSQVRRNPAMALFLARSRPYIIHLFRKNLLDILISRAAVRLRGRAHAWGDESVGNVRVCLDPNRIIWLLRRLEAQQAAARSLLRASRTPTFEVEYERIAEDQDRLAAVFRFLGVDARSSSTSSMQRLNHTPKTELVENWEEIRSVLVDTRYSSFVE